MASVIQSRRGMMRGQHVERTHCRHGHLLTDDNITTNALGHRKCKACYRAKQARSRKSRAVDTPRAQMARQKIALVAHVKMERDHYYHEGLRGERDSGSHS